ncbi:Chitin synthase, class 3 [Serendipita sp. 401]|nr:Chitin synthase, class 3 [Serendipita sp. 401]
MHLRRTNQMQLGYCLRDTIRVGFIDTQTIGCVASNVVLIVSLIFIIGVVAIKFAMAVIFGWFLSWRLGSFKDESWKSIRRRAAEVEQWSDDIYRPAPARYRPNVPQGKPAKNFLPVTSRFSKAEALKGGARPFSTYGDKGRSSAPSEKSRPLTAYSTVDSNRKSVATQSLFSGKSGLAPPAESVFRGSRSSSSLPSDENAPCPFPLYGVVQQPPSDFMPFNFPLAHTICLVTAYSESVEGLRTTLDSLATTDYPNSHKLIMVIADGMVKGSGNDKYTPEIVLSMMKDLVIPEQDVEAHSYVAIADGHKRHNMAKVYAGFYDYDDNTVERKKQQRVPMVLVSKVGNPLEQNDAKRGNRGKRDSQIVLMSFLQKIMFDERMTTFEYEFFNSIWRCTGVCPDKYELALCVDADTKVFPDSLTRMTACMVNDPEIMGLCGETKIANKGETWVTMIQVFEYYISHHMTKAFESMFGGVTCLPGCFSMYRIKAPKTDTGYWVPILANPDIVEHYSENIVDTLHKKNLLLLGEDRYLTTLMLKTFPKRKMVFCPQAVCKTIVPDRFGVLLSQRRRWINSTIHNLAELLLVRDLCGTFCFSMQFVVFMELAGTLVLPAAISFTIYLLVISAVKGAKNTEIPLILLAIILGLPGLLIVVTSRKVAYVGWMLVYLLSLPIWNFVLPSYAFWHFDDFSWGQTRKVAGDKGGNHGDKEGEFDSTHIVMKRWAEFERDRRWKLNHSRDSTYLDPYRSISPRRPESHRHSLVSMGDSYDPYGRPPTFMHSQHSDSPDGSPQPFPRSRQDSAPLLMLPAPLAVTHQPSSVASSFADTASTFTSPGPEVRPNYRLNRVPDDPNTYGPEYRDSDRSEREPILISPAGSDSLISPGGRGLPALGSDAIMRQATGGSSYPGETPNPYRHSQHHVAAYEQMPSFQGYSAEVVEEPSPLPPRQRGVSLIDHGVVANPDGPVRRTPRSTKRSSATITSTSTGGHTRAKHQSMPLSPTAQTQYLPPGAAPPQPQPQSGRY